MPNKPDAKATPRTGITQRTRSAKPFNAIDAGHVIARVAETLDWKIDDVPRFLKAAEHVEYGLSAEVELAAILRWFGPCRMVHRLSEDDFVSDPKAQQIPDLLAAFESGDERVVTLIEVKTTQDPRLRLKLDYRERLAAYARIVGHPLLIGWRCRAIDMWLLFDPFATGVVVDDVVEYSLEEVIKADLMSLIAGDFYLVPVAGAGLRFEMERTGEKEPTGDGYAAVFTMRRAYFHDGAGNAETKLPAAMQWTVLAAMESNSKVDDDRAVQSFTSTGSLTRAQNILRAALGFQVGQDERIHWKGVARDLDAVVRCEDILRESRSRFGTYVQYIFLQQPVPMPAFLPKAWRSKSAPD